MPRKPVLALTIPYGRLPDTMWLTIRILDGHDQLPWRFDAQSLEGFASLQSGVTCKVREHSAMQAEKFPVQYLPHAILSSLENTIWVFLTRLNMN